MKKLLALVLSVMMVASLAACGSSAPAETAAATTAAATEAATTAAATTAAAATEAAATEAAAAEISGTLNVVLGADIAPKSVPLWVEKFNELYPNVTLNVSLLDLTNYAQTYEPYVASGEMPDVMSVSAVPYYDDLAQKGLILDLGDFDVYDKELEVAQKAFTTEDGKKWGIAASLSTMVLFYNEDMFAKAGITTLPECWEDFLDCCEKLKAAGFAPLAVAGAGANNLGHSFVGMGVANEIYASGYDKNWAIANKKGAYDFTAPEWQKVLERLAILRDKGYFAEGYESADLYEAIRVFSAGEAAMTIQQSTQAGNVFVDPNMKLSCMPIPFSYKGKEPASIVFAGDGYGLGKNSNNAQNMELAKLFLRFISYDYAYIFQNESKSLAPFADAADIKNYEIDDCVVKAFEANSKMQQSTLPAVGFNGTAYTAIKQIVQEVALGLAEPGQWGEYVQPAQDEYAATVGK